MATLFNYILPELEVCHCVAKTFNFQSTHLGVQRKILQVKRTGRFDSQPYAPQDVTSVHDSETIGNIC